MNLPWYLAKKFLFSSAGKNFRSTVIFIATLGIFFATTAVMVSLGVLAGYQRVYQDAVLNFGAHLVIFNERGVSEKERGEIETWLNSSQIKNQHSFYHLYEVLAPGKNGFKPLLLKGIEPDKMQAMYPLSYQELSHGTKNGIFVGKDILSAQPQIADGGSLQYLILKDPSGELHTRYGRVQVEGTFDSGYYDFNARLVLMPLTELSKIAITGPALSGAEIRLDDPSQLAVLKAELEGKLSTDFQVITWQELNRELFSALMLEKTVVFAVAILVLLIACLNIFGFNFLFFMERKHEFLILSSLGASLSLLRGLLSLLSLILGGVSALFGGALSLVLLSLLSRGKGIPLDPEVYFVDHVPVYFEWSWFLIFCVGVFLLCYLTSRAAGRVVIRRFMSANLIA